ncbi:hypothetical protein BN938_1793 [Mucinivorans hirudinis]|uniref:Uncharacterized protein n=1 Tax=Mucinivorans hirudinis TaxID=1433126 RepID=A0A060RD42_9BACT|nr:hypothetical protein BN938_1793 [Mucinivorans hirudinis]
MAKITLDDFCNQWSRGKQVRPWHSLLAKNAEDFATLAGEYALSRFRTSFVEGGFYGSGQKWAPRESKWGEKFTHPIMIDQEELKNKIKGEMGKGGSYSVFGKRDYRRRYRYDIWTSEQSKAIKGKRGKKRGRNQSYAAVHNTNPSLGLYTVNQYSSRRPVQRQFIGHSEKLLNTIERVFVPLIFRDFPGYDKR